MGRTVTFGEFGEAFLLDLLQHDLIERTLQGTIPPVTYFKMGPISGKATFDGKLSVSRDVGEDEISFATPVTLTLIFDTPASGLNTGGYTFDLRIVFRTYERLLLHAHVPEIGWNEISGIPGLAQIVAGQINEKIRASFGTRVIDLEALLLEQGSSGTAAEGATAVRQELLPEGLLPRTLASEFTLRPGARSRAQLLLLEGERLKLKVYARLEEAPGLAAAGASLLVELFPPGSRDAAAHTIETVNYHWGVHRLLSCVGGGAWFVAPKTGWYRLESSIPAYSTQPVEIALVQQREFSPGHVPPGRRISFRTFGENFVQLGMSGEMLRLAVTGKLNQLLAGNGGRFPLPDTQMPPIVEALLVHLELDPAAAVIEVQPRIGEVTVPAGGSDRLALRNLPFEVRIRIIHRKERLLGFMLKGIARLGIETAVELSAINIRLLGIESVEVDEGGIEGTAADFVKGRLRDLTELVDREVPHWIEKLVGEKGLVVLSIVIAEVSRQLQATTLAAAAPPEPRSNQVVQASASLKPRGVARKEIQLFEGERLSLKVTVATVEPAFIWAALDIAVCDALGGSLAFRRIMLERSRGSGTLGFTAPKDGGVFHVALQAHPEGGDEWQEMKCKIRMEVRG